MLVTNFPVSAEQLREYCGYHADTDGYEYEMIFPRQYPPFADGTFRYLSNIIEQKELEIPRVEK